MDHPVQKQEITDQRDDNYESSSGTNIIWVPTIDHRTAAQGWYKTGEVNSYDLPSTRVRRRGLWNKRRGFNKREVHRCTDERRDLSQSYDTNQNDESEF